MKANYFNLTLLLAIGTAFVMCVVSVTNPMYTMNMTANPAPVNISTESPDSTTSAPTATTTTTTAAPPSTASTTPSPGFVAAAQRVARGVAHHQHRMLQVQDLPLIVQTFTITCPMFGNCSRSGAGVSTDKAVGDLNVLSEKLNCGTANIARAFCLITLILSVVSTIAAAGAAQELSCAQRRWVRIVILVGAIGTFVFSLIAVVMVTLLRQCLSSSIDNVQTIVPFFSKRSAESNVDSIAFPVYVTAMMCSAACIVLSIMWIMGRVGPPVVEPEPEAAEGGPADVGDQPLLDERGLSAVELKETDKIASPLMTQKELDRIVPSQRAAPDSTWNGGPIAAVKSGATALSTPPPAAAAAPLPAAASPPSVPPASAALPIPVAQELDLDDLLSGNVEASRPAQPPQRSGGGGLDANDDDDDDPLR